MHFLAKIRELFEKLFNVQNILLDWLATAQGCRIRGYYKIWKIHEIWLKALENNGILLICNVNSFGGVLEENRFLQVGPAGSATTAEAQSSNEGVLYNPH